MEWRQHGGSRRIEERERGYSVYRTLSSRRHSREHDRGPSSEMIEIWMVSSVILQCESTQHTWFQSSLITDSSCRPIALFVASIGSPSYPMYSLRHHSPETVSQYDNSELSPKSC